MFLLLVFGGFLLFAVWAALYEMFSMKVFWPKETGHFLLIAIALLVGGLLFGAI